MFNPLNTNTNPLNTNSESWGKSHYVNDYIKFTLMSHDSWVMSRFVMIKTAINKQPELSDNAGMHSRENVY